MNIYTDTQHSILTDVMNLHHLKSFCVAKPLKLGFSDLCIVKPTSKKSVVNKKPKGNLCNAEPTQET